MCTILRYETVLPGQFIALQLLNAKALGQWTLDRFTKTFFWNFQKCQAVLCHILIDKHTLEKVYSSNIAPSLSSVNYLFHKAKLP